MSTDSHDGLNKVLVQARELALEEANCEKGYARLGWYLLQVAEMQLWKVMFDSFRTYLGTIANVSKKSPGQLQQYLLTVRDLSDTFTLAQLEQMGITKAMKLRGAKDYAIVLPVAIIEAALDPNVTVRDLKKLISTNLKMPEEEGDYLDLGMEFMVSPEERLVLEEAVRVAMHTDPLIKSTISQSAQMKEVALRFAMEFLGSHTGDGI